MESKSRHIKTIDQLEAYIRECEERLINEGKFKFPIYYNTNGPNANGDPWTFDATIGIWSENKEGFMRTVRALWAKDNSCFTYTDVGVIDGMDLKKMKYHLAGSFDNKKKWKEHKAKVAELKGDSESEDSDYKPEDSQSDTDAPEDGRQWWCIICEHNDAPCEGHQNKTE